MISITAEMNDEDDARSVNKVIMLCYALLMLIERQAAEIYRMSETDEH